MCIYDYLRDESKHGEINFEFLRDISAGTTTTFSVKVTFTSLLS